MATVRDVSIERPPVTAQFTVIIDTREQSPYQFESIRADVGADPLQRPIIIPTTRRFLPQGDYSIAGHDVAVAIERKSIGDLFGTLGRGRRRFEAELLRLQSEATFAAVVVEAEWSEILGDPPARCRLNPKTIFRSVLAWQQRYPRVHWLMVPGRAAGEIATYRTLERFWVEQQRREKRKSGLQHVAEPAFAGPQSGG